MKEFKDFLKELKLREIYGTIVDVPPVHGSHANPPKKKKIKEIFSLFKKKTPPQTASDLFKKLSGGKDEKDHTQLSYELEQDNNSKKNTPEENDHLKKYTEASNILNVNLLHLSENKHPSEWTSEDHKQIEQHTGRNADIISKAIAKHTSPTKRTVYHGTGYDPEKIMSEDKTNRFVHPNITSTSINPRVAAHHASFFEQKTGERPSNPFVVPVIHHVLAIHLDEHTPSLHLGSRSAFPKEQETVLPHGMVFEHHGHEDHAYTDESFNHPVILRVHNVKPVRSTGANWIHPEEK